MKAVHKVNSSGNRLFEYSFAKYFLENQTKKKMPKPFSADNKLQIFYHFSDRVL